MGYEKEGKVIVVFRYTSVVNGGWGQSFGSNGFDIHVKKQVGSERHRADMKQVGLIPSTVQWNLGSQT